MRKNRSPIESGEYGSSAFIFYATKQTQNSRKRGVKTVRQAFNA